MRSTPIHQARASLSELVDRALAGEPQRITRHGRDAVVMVSEAEWSRGPGKPATLGALLADFARDKGFSPEDFDRPWTREGRELGADFTEE